MDSHFDNLDNNLLTLILTSKFNYNNYNNFIMRTYMRQICSCK